MILFEYISSDVNILIYHEYSQELNVNQMYNNYRKQRLRRRILTFHV